MSKAGMFKVTKCNLERTTQIQQQIFVARGQRVMLDSDLAKLYGVTTKHLNQQLKRNLKRFPADFAFQLTLDEAKELLRSRSQFVTLNRGGNIKHPPHVFTEHGAIMLATVLNSRIAVQASVFVVRAFVRMRSMIAEYSELSARVDKLEENYDNKFHDVFEAIRRLIAPRAAPRRLIGFVSANSAGRSGKRK